MAAYDNDDADARWREVLHKLVKRPRHDEEFRARVEATGAVIDNFEAVLERTRRYRAAPPSAAIACRTYWWGFQLEIPHTVLATWIPDTTESPEVVAAIGAIANTMAPFRRRAAAYIASRIDELQQLDRGAGTYVSMTWMAPNIFVPSSARGR
jgi:hypothetical protein